MSVLKLILKKEVFESIVNEHIDVLRFETSSYYMSKFTTNKRNTVEGLKADPSLFKSFDTVEFSCTGEKLTFDVLSVKLVDGETTEFELTFNNLPVEDIEEEEPEVVESVESREDDTIEIIATDDTGTNSILNEINEELSVEVTPDEEVDETEEIVEEIELTGEDILKEVFAELEKKDNVFITNSRVLKIGYLGKIYGCDKVLTLARNEHNYGYCFEDHVLAIDENLIDNVNSIGNSGFVFLSSSESKYINDELHLHYVVLKRLDVMSLM